MTRLQFGDSAYRRWGKRRFLLCAANQMVVSVGEMTNTGRVSGFAAEGHALLVGCVEFECI